ncbi:hypothetical protein SAMN05444354_110186 [Stigmatella aurantiaca]|uniref:Uncharacterized protein n=1 Tax=Stigmatella aurantiaca TaxID=41 RepID=A0A1H7UT72_STIAU|nr:hypothetical protein [Stigmatella aurantiaca]SEM00181.1 hypothetical protein SAMN05444354_110186 [Stigmatella aurantiaca]
MPRSYSYDHFQVPAAEPRSRALRREDKQHLADSHHVSPGHDGGIHYGKSHAQTEEILKARAAEPRHAKKQEDEEEQAPAQMKAEALPPPVNRNTAPIGALPMTEELPPRRRLKDLLDEATRQVEAIQGGIGDVVKAAQRLASLPGEAVRLAARRLNPLEG